MPFARHFPSKTGPRLRWALTSAVLGLIACGGGGGSSEAPSTLGNMVGAWKGNPSEGSPLAGLILPNGTYWAFYGGVGAGFEQGTANATNSNFRANARVYPNDFTTSDVSISAEMSNGALNGSRTVGTTRPQRFSLERIPSTHPPTDFVAQQVLSSHVEGVWSSVTLSGESATLQISSGNFMGSGGNNRCSFSGTLLPQNNSYAYDVVLTFESNCGLQTTSATGIAMVYKIDNGIRKQILMAVQNADRSKGWLFSATQP